MYLLYSTVLYFTIVQYILSTVHCVQYTYCTLPRSFRTVLYRTVLVLYGTGVSPIVQVMNKKTIVVFGVAKR